MGLRSGPRFGTIVFIFRYISHLSHKTRASEATSAGLIDIVHIAAIGE